MKITLYVCLMLGLISLSCTQKKQKEVEIIKEQAVVSILQDAAFENGIALAGTSSANPIPIDTLYPFETAGSPVHWRIGQWGSRYDLAGMKGRKKGDSVIYVNRGKKLGFVGRQGDAAVVLAVFASNEFDKPRQANEDWPHLLLEQKIDTTILLTKMNSLQYGIQAKLNYCNDLMSRATFNPDLHTAQITYYLAVQNVNDQSAGKDDYFWFGLPLYDYRYPDIEVYAAQDSGKEDATHKFIYNVASSDLFQNTMHQMQWINIHRDIYPLIETAFRTAKERGFLKNTEWKDLAISSMNLGWEVPGTFDCEIAFKNLKLQAKLKPTQ